MVRGRMPLVYYDHRNSGGASVFKLASLSFFPFGKEVRYGGGAGSFIMNIVWLIVSGFWLAVEHLILAQYYVLRSLESRLGFSILNWQNWR